MRKEKEWNFFKNSFVSFSSYSNILSISIGTFFLVFFMPILLKIKTKKKNKSNKRKKKKERETERV